VPLPRLGINKYFEITIVCIDGISRAERVGVLRRSGAQRLFVLVRNLAGVFNERRIDEWNFSDVRQQVEPASGCSNQEIPLKLIATRLFYRFSPCCDYHVVGKQETLPHGLSLTLERGQAASNTTFSRRSLHQTSLSHENLVHVEQDVAAFDYHPLYSQVLAQILGLGDFVVHLPANGECLSG
jgi:hypothetical protein